VIRRLLPLAAVAVALSGCALLSSPPEAQLYRFGLDTAATQPLPVDAPQLNLRRVEIVEAAQTDRILSITGGSEAAYIGAARWVAPAQDLYIQSLESAFAAQARRVRLIGAREALRGDQTLDVDVRAFEARYDAPDTIPTVVVTVRARLLQDRELVSEQVFTSSRPAAENRVSAIVQAFDAATTDVNGQIVAWADATVTPAPPSAP
jgi:cholesterol transport system auxiliary component